MKSVKRLPDKTEKRIANLWSRKKIMGEARCGVGQIQMENLGYDTRYRLTQVSAVLDEIWCHISSKIRLPDKACQDRAKDC